MVQIRLISRNTPAPSSGTNTAYLQIDRWNDFSFITMFYLTVYDEDGIIHDIGNIKIGFIGQDTSIATYEEINSPFESLADNFFSLGQGVEYYHNLSAISPKLKMELLKALNDMVFNPLYLEKAKDENVFKTSLLREVSLSTVKGQFSRVLNGQPPLTDFSFSFVRPEQANMSETNIAFQVNASSTPSTNIHALIGRNGVGKTTLLNDMIYSVISSIETQGKFYQRDSWLEAPIDKDYFSSLVSVSFSAFDPFQPPQEQSDPSKGTCYFYIGLKNRRDPQHHRTLIDLRKDCVEALIDCFRNVEKSLRWKAAIQKLGSDENFDAMNLGILEEKYKLMRNNYYHSVQSDSKEFKSEYYAEVEPYLNRMSSGHAVVLLTITRLVATVEEKTLVLLDEPESHLHPPLLSAFIRALSDLLHDRNGVAIIATHSPVVLQEVPQSCVWKINRVGFATTYRRPEIETFGENVGFLTREIFGLEVTKSGFYDLLVKSVENGGTYNQILDEYDSQLGLEGRVILKSLIVHRDDGNI